MNIFAQKVLSQQFLTNLNVIYELTWSCVDDFLNSKKKTKKTESNISQKEFEINEQILKNEYSMANKFNKFFF